jgi:hypothetical protein
MTSAARRTLVVIAIFTVVPRLAPAQSLGAASIVGVVKDDSGAVLPGVTVEASSPVLIEKARTTVTDGDGRYQLAELRPGTYTVSFSLQGFATYRREGLGLTANFVATINAELKVGQLSETIVVSGQGPLVDVRSVSKGTIVSKETLDALPTSKSIGGILALVPGAVSPANGMDTGGTKGEQSVRISVYGARPADMRQMTNGMLYSNLNGDGAGRLYFVNPVTIQENVIDLGTAGSAQYQLGGAVVNTIPREGGNRFSGSAFGTWTGHSLQSSNFGDDLKAQGLQNVNSVRNIWDTNELFGGPVRQDRWWFVVSNRNSGSTVRTANLFHDSNLDDWIYTPDFSRPVDPVEKNRSSQVRTTIQLTTKDKISGSFDLQRHYRDQAFGELDRGDARIENAPAMCHNDSLTQFTWTRPQSNTVLFEGGATVGLNTYGRPSFGTDLYQADYSECGQSEPFRVAISDPARGVAYHGVGAITTGVSNQFNSRASMSYVTGSHNVKTGFTVVRGNVTTNVVRDPRDVGGLPISYTFANGVPTQLTLFAGQYSDAHLDYDLGAFVQDQWALRSVTLSGGLRFDAMRASLGAVENTANALFAGYSSPAVNGVPNWRDLNARFGASWDLFGDGTTAIKGGVNRYVAAATTGVATQFGPTANFSTNRTWTDANGNYLPDCDLKNPAAQDLRAGGGDVCGPYTNPTVGTFGANTTVADPDFTNGWFKRGYNWRFSTGIERQLFNRMAVSGTFTRTIYGNFTVTDNLNLTPADFDPFCVTVPGDSRLPRSGQTLCGLYDQRVNVATSNLVTFADKYIDKYPVPGFEQSPQTEHFNGFDLAFNSRLPRGGSFAGGWSVGNSVQSVAVASANGGALFSSTSSCFVVDNPQQLTGEAATIDAAGRQIGSCAVESPYQHRFRFNGAYELPWAGVQIAGVYQDLPGPQYVANRTYTSAEVQQSLGRPLRTGTVTVDLLAPVSAFGDRLRQLDLRASKLFRLPNNVRVQANVDVYNVTNANTATSFRSAYTAPGANTLTPWLQPTQILDGRFAKFSLQFDF